MAKQLGVDGIDWIWHRPPLRLVDRRPGFAIPRRRQAGKAATRVGLCWIVGSAFDKVKLVFLRRTISFSNGPPMTIRASMAQLEAFFWVARLGGFRQAAERLHRSQPTISLRIQELEGALGTRLFDRSGHCVSLTAPGREMLAHVERILPLIEEMENKIRATDPLHGLLRLGVNDTFALACLGELLTALERLYPDLRVDVSVDISTALSDQLAQRQLDIAFLVAPEVPHQITVERLGWIENSWVASPMLRLPSGPVTPHDLIQFRILTNPAPSYMHDSITCWFGESGLEVRRISTCKSLPILAHLAACGCGVGVLPRAIIEDDLSADRLRMLTADPPVRPLEMFVAFQSAEASPGISAVMDLAKDLLVRSLLLRS
jgi:DNA-binding transcriptional LysR family regulator